MCLAQVQNSSCARIHILHGSGALYLVKITILPTHGQHYGAAHRSRQVYGGPAATPGAEHGVPKKVTRNRDNLNIYGNVKFLCGNPKDWEGFSEKLKSQVAAGDMLAASVLDVVETKFCGTDLEEDDYYTYVAEDDTCSGDQIRQSQHEIAQLFAKLDDGRSKPSSEEMLGETWTVGMEATVHDA